MTDGVWQSNWTDITPDDIARVSRFLEKGNPVVVSGGVLGRFEKAFAKFTGTNHAVAFNSGTSSIYAALWAAGVGSGDDVLVCDYGFHAMAAAVIALGARVIPCDMLTGSFTLDPDDIPRARTPKTKAVLVHHPWGVPADLDRIRKAADGLVVISDASHAHGATYAGKPLATSADITCYSLGRDKLITGGELGCAVTNDPKLRDRLLVFGHVNRVPSDLRTLDWAGNAVGLKLRPHAVALVLASAQLKRFDEKLKLLRATCAHIENALTPLGLTPQAIPQGAQRSYWRIVFQINDSTNAEPDATTATTAITKRLTDAGIPVEPPHYLPTLQAQSIFQWPGNEKHLNPRPCPVAQETTPRTLTLPAPVTLSRGTLKALESVTGSRHLPKT